MVHHCFMRSATMTRRMYGGSRELVQGVGGYCHVRLSVPPPLCRAVASGTIRACNMSSTMSEFAIKVTDDHNAGNVIKSNQRMQDIIAKYAEGTSANYVRVPPDQIGSSTLNRLTNIVYVHHMGADLKKNGFDPTRCQRGILRRLSSKAKIEALQAHNQELASGSDLFPSMFKDRMVFECFATTHISTALALFRSSKGNSPITNESWTVPSDDLFLKEVVDEGHVYLILNEDLPDGDAEFISNWKNADNNQSAATSVEERIRTAHNLIVAEMKLNQKAKMVRVANIVAKMISTSLVKIRPDHTGDIVRIVLDLGAGEYVTFFLLWHAMNGNPKDLAVSTSWFKDLCDKIKKEFPHVELGLMFVHYSGEQILEQVRPQAARRTIGFVKLGFASRN